MIEEIDKSTWGDGEWQHEKDFEYAEISDGRLAIVIKRNPEMGNLLGYIGVNKKHPLYGKHYNELYDYSKDFDLDVHGGWTYSSSSDGSVYPVGKANKYWWFGFDCAHYRDYVPAMEARLNELMPERVLTRDELYRSWLYVSIEAHRAAFAMLFMDGCKKMAVSAGRFIYFACAFILIQLWMIDFNAEWTDWLFKLVLIAIWLGIASTNWIIWRKNSLKLRWRSE